MSEEPRIEPKIEPTMTSVADAPSIVAESGSPAEAPKIELEVTPEAKADEAPKVETKIEPKIEAIAAPAKEPVMPRAAQLAPEPLAAKAAPIWLNATRASDATDAKPEKPAPAAAAAPRNGSRFPLLAATVAVAASLGAIAGSFGGTVFGRTPIETNIAAQGASNAADEIRALKDTVAQLRANTKTLSDNVAALKLGMSNTSAQLTKMNEALDRRAAAAPAPETTGSIGKPVPAVLGTLPAPLQHPVVAGWTLRRVYDGAALIEGREGVIEVEPGITIAGLGRIDDIKKQDGRWVVFTSKGIIVPPGK